jgi:hypothetical protein
MEREIKTDRQEPLFFFASAKLKSSLSLISSLKRKGEKRKEGVEEKAGK